MNQKSRHWFSQHSKCMAVVRVHFTISYENLICGWYFLHFSTNSQLGNWFAARHSQLVFVSSVFIVRAVILRRNNWSPHGSFRCARVYRTSWFVCGVFAQSDKSTLSKMQIGCAWIVYFYRQIPIESASKSKEIYLTGMSESTYHWAEIDENDERTFNYIFNWICIEQRALFCGTSFVFDLCAWPSSRNAWRTRCNCSTTTSFILHRDTSKPKDMKLKFQIIFHQVAMSSGVLNGCGKWRTYSMAASRFPCCLHNITYSLSI